MSSKSSFANTGSLQSVLWTASEPESEASAEDSPSALVVPTSLPLWPHSPDESLNRETGDSSEPPPQLVTGRCDQYQANPSSRAADCSKEESIITVNSLEGLPTNHTFHDNPDVDSSAAPPPQQELAEETSDDENYPYEEASENPTN